jgi:hypothetical protein
MGLDLNSDDDYLQRRMQHLECRYRRAQFIFRGAQMQYRTLRETRGVSVGELIQSTYRIRRVREQLEDILSTIEFLEDQNYGAIGVRRVG